MRELEKITDVNVINVETGESRQGCDIWLEGGRIASIRRADGGRRGRRGLSGEGLFAIPGLIDTHVHSLGLLIDDLPAAEDIPWMLRQQRNNLRAFLCAGVTTIRDMGAPLHLIRWYAALARRGVIASPRILAAGPVLTVAGGYPDFVPVVPRALELTLGPLVVGVRSLGHARAVVRRLAAARVACIKVCYQSARYDDARTSLPTLPLPVLRAIVDEARVCGVKVAVHHIYRGDLEALLDVPFDFLEHVAIDEVLTDSMITRIVARGLPVSTTMMTYGIIDHLEGLRALVAAPAGRLEPAPAAFLDWNVRMFETGDDLSPFVGRRVIDMGSTVMRASVKKLRDAGATILFGTDSGGAITPPGFPVWELSDMVRAGLTPLEALRTATTAAAEALGLRGLGRLETGAIADIVLLRADPLRTIEAVSDVAAVIKGGRLVSTSPDRRP